MNYCNFNSFNNVSLHRISNNIYGAVYNQSPVGKCKIIPCQLFIYSDKSFCYYLTTLLPFYVVEGCEDVIVLPNHQAIVTTVSYLPQLHYGIILLFVCPVALHL